MQWLILIYRAEEDDKADGDLFHAPPRKLQPTIWLMLMRFDMTMIDDAAACHVRAQYKHTARHHAGSIHVTLAEAI